MRVGLNLTFLGPGAGGVGRYATKLAEALIERTDVEVEVVAAPHAPESVRHADWAAEVRWTTLPIRPSRPRTALVVEYVGLSALAIGRRWDVLHSPANAGPVCVPGVASVITMHDAIWLKAEGDWGPPEAVRAMKRVAVPTARRASRVLTDSLASARELVQDLGLRGDRLSVTPLGVSTPTVAPIAPAVLRERFGLGSDPFVLCVAQKRPYKNQEALIRAVARLRDRRVRLVLPGAPTDYEDHLRAVAAECELSARTVFIGWVEEEELEGLYAEAACVVLPSRLEGFGLPVLEAMIRGVPVACAAIDTLREVAGDAALFFDQADVASVSDAIEQILGDDELRARLRMRGEARAAEYTWSATARSTVEAYREAMGG